MIYTGTGTLSQPEPKRGRAENGEVGAPQSVLA